MPNLIKAFVEDFQLNADEYEKLVNSFKNKNLDLIKLLSPEIFEISIFSFNNR